MPRVLAWNILHGGGTRRLPAIALTLVERGAEVIVLSEFRSGLGGQLRANLSDHGWRWQVSTEPPGGTNGLLIASKTPVLQAQTPPPPSGLEHRFLALELPDWGWNMAACHLPDEPSSTRKSLAWKHLTGIGRDWQDRRALLIGDFNAGRRRADTPAESGSHTSRNGALLGRLATHGYADAFRLANGDAREYSWFSHTGSGHRLDHTFVSSALAGSVRSAAYGHAERQGRLSDHAPLEVAFSEGAIDPSGGGGREPGSGSPLFFKGETRGDRLAVDGRRVYNAHVPEGTDRSKTLSKRS